MSVPDYLRFETGNPLTELYAGEWFQTIHLFGYFEKYNVRADGTLWLTPTQVVPTDRMQKDTDAPELEKVELPAVQILLHADIVLVGEDGSLVARFAKGIVESVRRYDDLSE